MKITISVFLGPFFLIALSACAPGFIYTDIVRPECTDMRGTTLGTKEGRSGAFKVDIPTSRIEITAEKGSKSFGDIAKANNITTFYSCDERTISILGGLFRKEEMILYGD